MRDCEYFEQLCSNSVDGTLTEQERQELSEHVKDCPSCAALLNDLEQMRAMLRVEPEIPATLHRDIMKRLSEEGRLTLVQPEKPARRMPVFTMVAAAAVVVMVVLGGGVGQLFGTKSSGSVSADTATMADGGISPVDQNRVDAVPRAADTAPETAAVQPKETEPQTKNAPQATPEMGASAPQPEAETGAGDNTAAGGSEASMQAAQEPRTDSNAAPQAAMPRLSSFDGGQPAEDAEMAAEETASLPESIRGTAVAYSYLAVGTKELPELDGVLLLSEGDYSYFSLSNNMAVLEKTLDSVEKAGYTVTDYENVGLVTDSKAESWLLIVKKE